MRESMFDSVIVARDRWLKPGGAMFPSHATMSIAPIRTGVNSQKQAEYEANMKKIEETKAKNAKCVFSAGYGLASHATSVSV